MRRIIACFAMGLALLAAAPTVDASDQDRARAAVRAGQARPLGEILAQVRGAYPGDLLDADLRKGGQRWVYRLKILGPDGRVQVLTVDAQSAQVLRVR